MSHYCICPACAQKFDRDKIQAVRVGARRYGHATCYPDNTDFVPLIEPKKKKTTKEEDPDLTKLKDYISKIFGDKARWAMITKQIKTYITENKYSYSGILKSLVYWYEVKGNSIEKSNYALGIVPFIYQDAYNYYYSLFVAKQVNENKTLQTEVREIIIPPPKKQGTKRKLFDLGEWNNEK